MSNDDITREKVDIKNLEDVARVAAEIAATTAIERYESEKRQQEKRKKDWRLRNTKLLLRHYRDFVEHSDETPLSPLDSAEALDDLYTDELTVESIRKSKQRTRAMVDFIQEQLQRYRIMCERSARDEDIRRYKVINAIYISDEILTAEQVAEWQNIDTRTVYKDINNGAKTLSVLIFGVDGIRFE